MAFPTIAVIGAGFTGSLLSLHLKEACPPGTRICLIERTGRFGPGLAHAEDQDDNLLNVTATRMSALPDQPSHFLDWLAAQVRTGGTPDGEAFVRRRQYGAYLAALVRNGCTGGPIELWHDEAVSLRRHDGGLDIGLVSGRDLRADFAILATGNGPAMPPHPEALPLQRTGIWQGDPWCRDALGNLDPAAAVLFIGAGQSMVDLVTGLLRRGHRGPLTALSRSGLLPRAYLPYPTPAWDLPPLPTRLAPLVRLIRQDIQRAMRAGLPWQSVLGAMAPHVQQVWRGLAAADQRRFLRHVRPWWEVHRHLMPPASADRIQTARDAGQFRLLAGRLAHAALVDGQAEVGYHRRGDGALQRLRADRVITCTGPCRDITRTNVPLFRSLLSQGLCRPHPLRLGLDVDASGAVLAHDGAPSDRLFTLGPLTRGLWWEVTAVPNIRVQCRDLAVHLAGLARVQRPMAAATA